jgi:hypothetical protein
MHARRPLLPLGRLADLWKLQGQLLDAVHIHFELAAIAFLQHAAEAVVLTPDPLHLLL